MDPGGLFTYVLRATRGRNRARCLVREKRLPPCGAVGWVEAAGQPNAAGMSALGVSYALRGHGRDGQGSAGRTQMAGEPAVGEAAVDITALFRIVKF